MFKKEVSYSSCGRAGERAGTSCRGGEVTGRRPARRRCARTGSGRCPDPAARTPPCMHAQAGSPEQQQRLMFVAPSHPPPGPARPQTGWRPHPAHRNMRSAGWIVACWASGWGSRGHAAPSPCAPRVSTGGTCSTGAQAPAARRGAAAARQAWAVARLRVAVRRRLVYAQRLAEHLDHVEHLLCKGGRGRRVRAWAAAGGQACSLHAQAATPVHARRNTNRTNA